MRTLAQIIEAAGGPRAIAEASGDRVKKDAVYKWPTIGIPDRHWPLLMSLTTVSADELFEANRAARAASPAAEAAE
jgi:hypothetical protein